MRHRTATALRRGAFVFAGLVATLVAHSATVGGPAGSLLTPFVLMSVCGSVTVATIAVGRDSGGDFVAWRAGRTFAALAAVQAVAHVALWSAPWLLGLSEHVHHGALADPVSIACHLIVAVVATLLLVFGQRILARLVAVIVALLGRVRSGPARPGPVARPAVVAPRRAVVGSRVTRGPPPLVV